MNILEQAKNFYDKTKGDMFNDLSTYAAHGYVFITPSSLLLIKPVESNIDIHPDEQWGVVTPNAWYVKTALGENSISEFIDRTPYPLPFVGWMRQLKSRPIKWYNLKSIIRRK